MKRMAIFPTGCPTPCCRRIERRLSRRCRRMGPIWAWAGMATFDRCFFFDEQGTFIEGYYVVGLLAEAFLQQSGPAKIVHDPRLTWNTVDIVESAGGEAVQSKTGHAFIKERMRLENAVYGGEMSAHHYFRDFAYCDSGMIPWLLVTGLVCASGAPLSQLVAARWRNIPAAARSTGPSRNRSLCWQRLRMSMRAMRRASATWTASVCPWATGVLTCECQTRNP